MAPPGQNRWGVQVYCDVSLQECWQAFSVSLARIRERVTASVYVYFVASQMNWYPTDLPDSDSMFVTMEM